MSKRFSLRTWICAAAFTAMFAASAAVGLAAVSNGPFGNPLATGSYDGVVANNASNDFTAIAFKPAGFAPNNAQTVPGSAPIGNVLGATALVDVAGSFKNTGGSAVSITLSGVLATGWTAQIFNSTGAGVRTGSTLSGAASATPSHAFSSVAGGATVNYVMEYTAPATAQAFVTYDSTLTATATSGTNTTHNRLIPGGPIYLIATQTFDALTCPSSKAVPGCKITYTDYYYNNAPTGTACVAPTNSVAAMAGGYFAAAGTAIITENGAATNNSWGANTNGLTAIATDTAAGTTWTGNTIGSKSFTATRSTIFYPGCTGQIAFSVVIK